MKNAVIQFEPDGYVLNTDKLMGRHAAGNAFLRAAVAGSDGEPLWAYTPHKASAEVFGKMVGAIDPTVQAQWVQAERQDLLTQNGCLYLPGPTLETAANFRLRAGPAAYSITGVTHTTASHGAMEAITALLRAPVMPWDALICTSTSVVATVQRLLDAEADSIRWRFGVQPEFTLPQFPVIPLGVHNADYRFSPEDRKAARAALGIAEDEIVGLFVGRLSFHAKAHPHAMYVSLQAAAKQTGKKAVLIQSGWFANASIEESFRTGAAQYCPDVRCMFSDGREQQQRQQGWAAADYFISLSDNVQETFGLTPIEAMAAGLPVVVTDWDGYKDTVRDGIDGFRIPTWMPPPGLGASLAMRHEAGTDTYDFYCGLNCQTVAVDLQVLTERLVQLFSDAGLRTRLGKAGQLRAQEVYDWSMVYRQYQKLWEELGVIRKSAQASPAWQAKLAAAPNAAPARMDPMLAFAHYPTAQIVPESIIHLAPNASVTAYQAQMKLLYFAYVERILPMDTDYVGRLFAALADGPLSVRDLHVSLDKALPDTIFCLAILAKAGFLRIAAS